MNFTSLQTSKIRFTPPPWNFHFIFLCKFALCMGSISYHPLGLGFRNKANQKVKSQNVKLFFEMPTKKSICYMRKMNYLVPVWYISVQDERDLLCIQCKFLLKSTCATQTEIKNCSLRKVLHFVLSILVKKQW